MFGPKDNKDTPMVSSPREKRVNSVIGEGSSMNGTLRIAGTVIVNGEFEGAIASTDTVVVGKSGKVKADLDVVNATIGGRMEGRIFAKERVELQTGCHFHGDVHAKSFVIQDGVFFQGNCSMGEAQKTGQTAKEPAGASKPDLGILKQS